MAALDVLRDGRVCGLGACPGSLSFPPRAALFTISPRFVDTRKEKPYTPGRISGLASTLGTLTSRISQATILNRKLVDDRTAPGAKQFDKVLDKRKPWSALWSIFLPSRRSHLRRKEEELRNSKIKDQITSRHTCVRKLIEQDLVGGKKRLFYRGVKKSFRDRSSSALPAPRG